MLHRKLHICILQSQLLHNMVRWDKSIGLQYSSSILYMNFELLCFCLIALSLWVHYLTVKFIAIFYFSFNTLNFHIIHLGLVEKLVLL